jgi:hypothetical protein
VFGPAEGVEFGFTFFFAPDVGKEGWSHSNNCDALRGEFIEIANQGDCAEVIHLRFGGDDYLTGIEEWDNGVKDIDFCLDEEELRELSDLE